MIATLTQALATFCIAFLNNYLARKDLKDSVRLEIVNETLKLGLEASKIKYRLSLQSDGGATLRVREDGGSISIPGGDASP